MTKRKGIILAGGTGTRLYPATRAVSKQLMPIHDKPMIYYSLSTLMLTGIQEILVISTPRDIPLFQNLLGDGSQWGLRFQFAIQENANGLAEAFRIGKSFIGDADVAMILGDNLYYGQGLPKLLTTAAQQKSGATVFAYRVSNPQRYGVVSFDENSKPKELTEKPLHPQSKWAVTGLYFYDNNVVTFARDLIPSARGELEITDLNRAYLTQQNLEVIQLGRGYAWFDAGTHESLADATEFVRILEKRQNLKIGCPEEIAYSKGYIKAEDVLRLAKEQGDTSYAAYLRDLVTPDDGLG